MKIQGEWERGGRDFEIKMAIPTLAQFPKLRGGERGAIFCYTCPKKYRNLPVAQWLPPRICSDNREVGGSNLTVSTDDPLG